jgi:hypothetical protein
MTAIYPAIKGHILPEQSVVTLASKLYEMLGEGKTIAYVTDEKDWQWAGKLLNDYNGKEGPHGYYKFTAIRHVESPRVSSATALRTAARANDETAFYAASGTDPKLTVNGQTYFDTVVAAVGANPEKVKKVAKKKVAEPTEGAPIVVAQAPIHIRNPKKAPQPYRNKGDIVPDTKPPSTEKRGVKGRPGQRPMPKYDEGSMGVSKRKETEFHTKLDKLVHNVFGKRKDEEMTELSTELLGKYKKAAGADAKKSDAEGNYARGDKRFKGINKATNKQFDNDLKKHKTDEACWKDYKQIGMKKKGGKQVPNCVPKK